MLILVNFLAPDSDSHSQYGPGSRKAKSMRIHAGPDPDPKHWALHIFFLDTSVSLRAWKQMRGQT
jgi:hypothetical protein